MLDGRLGQKEFDNITAEITKIWSLRHAFACVSSL
jgi:hypothetical protein